MTVTTVDIHFNAEVSTVGSYELVPARDPEQAWFWTPEWQAAVKRSRKQAKGAKGEHLDEQAFLKKLDDE